MARLAVKLCRAAFKRTDDALHGVVEKHPRRALQDAVTEFEIDKEIDLYPAVHITEFPFGNHMLERTVKVFRVDPFFVRPQGDAAAEFLTEHFERDHEVRKHHLMVIHVLARPDARRRRPRQEFVVRSHIGHQIVHLLGGIGQFSGL